MANPPFATLNHSTGDLGIPGESDLLRVGIRRYSGGSWSAGTAGSRCHSIAIDPHHGTRWIVLNDNGGIQVSTNSGSTWSPAGIGTPTRKTADIPWHLYTNEGYMTAGDFMFDPSQVRSGHQCLGGESSSLDRDWHLLDRAGPRHRADGYQSDSHSAKPEWCGVYCVLGPSDLQDDRP
jgi:hypothetical protein